MDETVLLDGSVYRINGTKYMEAHGETWADAEKNVNGRWHPVRNWDRRRELGRIAEERGMA